MVAKQGAPRKRIGISRMHTYDRAHPAIVDVLRSATKTRPVTRDDIVDALLARGFVTQDWIRNTIPWVI
jgi:hypothetical protein